MTKEEIELNILDVGDVIEDGEGTFWLIVEYDSSSPLNAHMRRIDGFVQHTGTATFLKVKLLQEVVSPRRIYAPDWNKLFNPLNTRILTRPFLASRPWKTLPAKRKITIQVEIAEGVNEIEIEGKMVRV